jgi:hypothetical protein
MLLELLGLTPEQVAENETWDPKKGKRTKDLGDRVGDGIMSVLTGSNYGQRVQEATKGQYLENMEDAYGDRIKKTQGVAGYDSIGDLSRLTHRKIEQELNNREQTQAARSKAAATTGLDRSNFMGDTDPGTILASATKLVKDEKDAKVTKAENKEEGRYRDSQDLIALQFANSAADRQADREYRRDQQAYQNRKLDMQEARLDRKDRQAAIQSMMAGLAQLGASIAI